MTTQIQPNLTQSLYEEDYSLWLDNTLKQLQKRELDRVDWEHLIEEIEALGNEQRRRVDSYLRQLFIHLLLYRYWEQERSFCGRGWQDEIGNFRYELELLLQSKTLYNYFLQEIDTVYPKARKQVIQKTELPPTTFPEQCPWSPEEILDNE
jgi:hypothetical protein